MNPIVMTPAGSYVDLSKIVAIGQVERLPSDYKVRFGFDVYFSPLGVPFNTAKSYSFPVIKDYDKPKDVCELMRNEATKDDGYARFKEFVEQSREDFDIKRLELVDMWKSYVGGK